MDDGLADLSDLERNLFLCGPPAVCGDGLVSMFDSISRSNRQ